MDQITSNGRWFYANAGIIRTGDLAYERPTFRDREIVAIPAFLLSVATHLSHFLLAVAVAVVAVIFQLIATSLIWRKAITGPGLILLAAAL